MEATAQVEITPKMMAEAFWNMGADDQSKFFEELANVIGDDTFHSNCQWFYLGNEMKTNDKARSMLMDVAAPLYMHTLMACDKW